MVTVMGLWNFLRRGSIVTMGLTITLFPRTFLTASLLTGCAWWKVQDERTSHKWNLDRHLKLGSCGYYSCCVYSFIGDTNHVRVTNISITLNMHIYWVYKKSEKTDVPSGKLTLLSLKSSRYFGLEVLTDVFFRVVDICLWHWYNNLKHTCCESRVLTWQEIIELQLWAVGLN